MESGNRNNQQKMTYKILQHDAYWYPLFKQLDFSNRAVAKY